MRTNATIKTKAQKRVEKAILLNRQMKIDFPQPFTINVSAFVPKAELKKPMPKVAVTIDVADDKIRCVSGSVDELAELYLSIAKFILDNKQELQTKVVEEQRTWMELHMRYQEAQLINNSTLKAI